MTSQPQAVVFATGFEALHRRFGHRLPPPIHQQIRALGIDLTRLQPAYTLDQWDRVMRLMLPALYPGLSEDQAATKMGYEFLLGLAETLLGQAMLGVGKLLGPRRMLERLNRSFRQIGNYANSQFESVSPTEVRVVTWMSPEFLWEWSSRPLLLAPYRVGVLQCGLELVGSPGRVEIVESKPETQHITYRLRWGESVAAP